MHILYVSDSDTLSGAENVMLGYLDRLDVPGIKTHVFYRQSNYRLKAALDARKTPQTTTDSFSNETIRTTWRPDALTHFACAFLRVRQELTDVIERERIDIVHSISYPAALYAALAARSSGRPHIWHEHGVKRIHALNRGIYRFVASTCRHVIGPSNAVTEALAKAGLDPDKVRTVYNGIDLSRFRVSDVAAARIRRSFGLASDQPAVGLFGQLLPHKGHRTLITAAPAILAQHPTTQFFVVGALENPPYEEQLRQTLRQTGIEHKFTFTGWRDDVPNVIRAMDVIVVPTLTPEPAALSLMETMAMGRPVVGSRTGGTPELVRDRECGLLFTPGSATELAERVIELITHPDLAREIGEAGVARVTEQYSLERHVDEMLGLYESCVKRTRVAVA